MKLAIDTTVGIIQIALARDEQILEKISTHEGHQAEDIAELLEGFLDEQNIKFSEISEVIILIGPGSFTGIRVGLAFLKGLLHSSDIKVVPLSNFHYYLSNFLSEIAKYPQIELLINCGKNKQEAYYQKLNHNLTLAAEPKIIAHDMLQAELSKKSFIVSDFPLGFTNDYQLTSHKSLKFANIFKLPNLPNLYRFKPLYIRPTYAKKR